MSDPIIARRCQWCGVAIRDHALFCPQCGKELQPALKDLNATITEPAPREIETQAPQDLNVTIAEPAPREIKNKDTADLIDVADARLRPGPAKARKPALGQQALGKMGAGIQKATQAARGVEDNVVHRVQKIRDVSSVVIDEASYDPSLRFVLVAVALFVMFLVMLLLSKLIT